MDNETRQRRPAHWTVVEENRVMLSGDVDRRNVAQLWQEVLQWKPSSPSVVIDLEEVSSTDSAALALVLHLIQYAKNNHCHIMLRSVPEKLLTLFEVSNALPLLNAHIPQCECEKFNETYKGICNWD